MDLGELVEVYGKQNQNAPSSSATSQTKPSQPSNTRPSRKNHRKYHPNAHNAGHTRGYAPQNVGVPAFNFPMISPPYYGPPMMMYPMPPSFAFPVPVPSHPSSSIEPQLSNQVDPSTSSQPPSNESQNSTSNSANSKSMSFTPNFTNVSYTPSYMYPYDIPYHYAYAPPQKRPKRAGNPKKVAQVPTSPGSDSASESSSSNTTETSSSSVIKSHTHNSSSSSSTPNKKLHCEPCEKSFKSLSHYEAHLTTHVSCPYEGCNFSAVKAALKLHEMLHINNMFAKLQTKEEIEQYREERKRKFPSLISAKEKENSQKMETSETSTRGSNPRSTSNNNRQSVVLNSSATTDSDILSSSPTVPTENSISISSSDQQNPEIAASTAGRTKRKRAPCKYWKAGKCNKGDHCTYSHGEQQPRKKQKKQEEECDSNNPSSNNTGTSGNSNNTLGSSSSSNAKSMTTLMSQFLKSEEKKENEAILQCLRYIVQNGFFQKSP